MMTPEEYTRYNALKAVGEFGREMTPAEFRQARKKRQNWMRSIIQGFKSVADYGAGSGWLKEMCGEMDIACVEIDEIAEKGSFERMDPVELVVCITVLEHMTPDEVIRFIDICSRKTQRLFIVTNNPRCAFSHFVLWDDITHVRMYSENSIRALLGSKGWTVEKVFYEDNVFIRPTFWQRLLFRILRRGLGMMFLSNTHNYWCIMAKSPEAED